MDQLRKSPNTYTKRITLVGIVIASGLAGLFLHRLPLFTGFENDLYDFRVQLASHLAPVSDDIVIVVVDDESLDRMEPAVGSWPWPRTVHAVLLDYCSAARVIGVDIMFPERQWQFGPADSALTDTVSELGTIILAAQFKRSDALRAPGENLARSALPGHADTLENPPLFKGVLVPFPSVFEAAAGIGHVNTTRDPDGGLRRYLAVATYNGSVYPSLALAVARRFAEDDDSSGALDPDRLLRVGNSRTPLESDGSFHYLPSRAGYTTYSAVDVIASWNAEVKGDQPIIDREVFRDKTVFLGSLATGLGDFEITPLGVRTAGVSIHATATDNLLHGLHYTLPGPWLVYVLTVALLLIPATVRFDKPRFFLLIGLSLALSYTLICLAWTWWFKIMLPMVAPLLGLLTCCIFLGCCYWAEELQQRRRIEQLEQAKQEFTDMLVHDLKNTISPVLMSMALFGLEETEFGKPDNNFWLKTFPGIVSGSANRLLAQINALLDIRRMEEGRLRLNRSPQLPGELIEPAIAGCRLAARTVDCEIHFQNTLDPGTRVNVDPVVFDRILGNLLWNAIKYSDPGSPIQVRCGPSGAQAIEISVLNESRPIPPEELGTLFTAFTTGVNRQSTEKLSSSGLGLTFCKLAMEAHGGTISLASPVVGSESGVVVKITVPVVNETNETASV